MTEEWRSITGYTYEVSNLGRIRNSCEQIIKPEIDRCGYLRTTLWLNGKAKHFMVHVLVAGAFIYPKPEGMTVNHINGIKHDARAENLEYLTQGENAQHSFDVLGRQSPKGSKHWRSKLTEESVKQMRLDRLSMPIAEVSQKYGVSAGNVSMICNRIKWRHVH